MNKAILIGNLAADPEFRTTQNGISNVSFRIACQRKYANQQGVREADFISCVAWRQTAEFIHKYFIKGNKIAVEGSIQTRSYDAQDGSKGYVTEVLVDNAEFVVPKSDGQYGAPPPAYGQQGYPPQSYQQSGYSQPAPRHQEQMRMDTASSIASHGGGDTSPGWNPQDSPGAAGTCSASLRCVNGFTEVDDDELPF